MTRRARLRLALAVASLALAWTPALAAQGPLQEREVSFRNGDVELHGTLILPAAAEKVPAVVFLHGSGPMTREGFRPLAERMARLGVAGLFYDKRGTGDSGGSWLRASLDDLAGDALAAVELLKSQSAIDATRIGFWGISQAGWIAPRAAARSADVGFLIVVSGGGASPREEEELSYLNAWDEARWSADQKADGLALVERYFHYLATGEGRPELARHLDELAAADSAPLHDLGQRLGRILPSEGNRANWAWVATYDPLPDIAQVRCPVLLLFGDADREEPTAIAVERWREGLARAGNGDVTLMVFPGAGHGIRMGRHDGTDRAPFAAGYFEVLLGWLWQHVVAAGS